MIKMRKPSGRPRAWQVIRTKDGTRFVDMPVRIDGTNTKPRAKGSPSAKASPKS